MDCHRQFFDFTSGISKRIEQKFNLHILILYPLKDIHVLRYKPTMRRAIAFNRNILK